MSTRAERSSISQGVLIPRQECVVFRLQRRVPRCDDSLCFLLVDALSGECGGAAALSGCNRLSVSRLLGDAMWLCLGDTLSRYIIWSVSSRSVSVHPPRLLVPCTSVWAIRGRRCPTESTFHKRNLAGSCTHRTSTKHCRTPTRFSRPGWQRQSYYNSRRRKTLTVIPKSWCFLNSTLM